MTTDCSVMTKAGYCILSKEHEGAHESEAGHACESCGTLYCSELGPGGADDNTKCCLCIDRLAKPILCVQCDEARYMEDE